MKCYPLGPVSPRFITISAATNATPIVLTLSAALGTGNNALNPAVDVLTIGGATVNTNANGFFSPGTYIVNSPTSITLVGIAGNGNYGGGGIASAPQRLIYSFNFPVIPGVADITKIQAARMLFTTAAFGVATATIFVGIAGMNQFNLANVFRPINPPPATGIFDYHELDAADNIYPIADYWVDAAKPGTEAVLSTFWLK